MSLWLMPHPDLNLYAIMAQLWWVNLGHIRGRVTESSRGGRWLKRITKHAAVLHPPTDAHAHRQTRQAQWKWEEWRPCQCCPNMQCPCLYGFQPLQREVLFHVKDEGMMHPVRHRTAAGEVTAETSQVSWYEDAMWETLPIRAPIINTSVYQVIYSFQATS